MTADRKTLEDALVAAGHDSNGRLPCPACKRDCEAFEIVEASDLPDFDHKAACGSCVLAAEARRDQSQALSDASWDGDLGASIKAKRNLLLDQAAWAIRPDTPLSANAIRAFGDYIKELGLITVTFADPQSVTFPQIPDIEYATAGETAARLDRFIEGITNA